MFRRPPNHVHSQVNSNVTLQTGLFAVSLKKSVNVRVACECEARFLLRNYLDRQPGNAPKIAPWLPIDLPHFYVAFFALGFCCWMELTWDLMQCFFALFSHFVLFFVLFLHDIELNYSWLPEQPCLVTLSSFWWLSNRDDGLGMEVITKRLLTIPIWFTVAAWV